MEWRSAKDVLQIVSGFILGGVLIPQTVNLREPGNPWFRFKPLAMPIGVVPSAIETFRARPDQAHLTAQDIEQLG